MPPIEVVAWDGKDYGTDWKDLAAAYFHAAGLLRKDEEYDPNEQGVPQEFFDAWAEHDNHFIDAVYAWLHEHRDDPRLGGDVGLRDAPWIIEWAHENYLGRWDSKHQWGDMVLGNELPESEWGVTWDHHINWDDAVREADVVFIQRGEDTFAYDDRGNASPATYRNDWLAARKMAVGEIVLLHVFENPAEEGVMQLPGRVRGKWRRDCDNTDVMMWRVAVEMNAVFCDYERGDVVVFDHDVVRRQPAGQPWRSLTYMEVTELPTVRVVHRRAVPAEGPHE
jgi:hypothetical protein